MGKNLNNYISPEMEIVNIEVEQAILSASTEDLGMRNLDQEW
jgi:hypothetical protein